MKKFSLHLLLVFGILGLGFLAMPAFAQDAAKMQELQGVIDAQQRQNEAQQSQIEAQQKQLDAQRQLLQNLQKQMESLAKDADTEGARCRREARCKAGGGFHQSAAAR